MKKFEVRGEDPLIDQVDKLALKHRRSRNDEILAALEHWLHYSKEVEKFIQRLEAKSILLEERRKLGTA